MIKSTNTATKSETTSMQNTLGIISKPQLGGDVETHCGRCKDTREHVIAAVSATGAIERVQCRTCQSNHIYRIKKATTRTASTRTRSSAPGSKKTLAELEQAAGPARPYSMQSRFKVGERIEHPKFGTGLVIEERSGKIDVKFGRELKTLVNGA